METYLPPLSHLQNSPGQDQQWTAAMHRLQQVARPLRSRLQTGRFQLMDFGVGRRARKRHP